MNCELCNSDRILEVSGCTSDRCAINFQDNTYDGYVPYNLGIGGGDYISFNLCLNCGRIQGDFPIMEVNLE